MVGVVDKVVLLEAVRESQLSDGATLANALVLAHCKDISAWQKEIALWIQQSDSKSPLIQLQQTLEIPLIEIRLVLLLEE